MISLTPIQSNQRSQNAWNDCEKPGTSKVCNTNCGQLMIPYLAVYSALMKWSYSHCEIVMLWYSHFRVHVFNPSNDHKVPISTIMQFSKGGEIHMGQTIGTQRTTDHYRSEFKTVGSPSAQFCSVPLRYLINAKRNINNKILLGKKRNDLDW